jgi:hypothetical protein
VGWCTGSRFQSPPRLLPARLREYSPQWQNLVEQATQSLLVPLPEPTTPRTRSPQAQVRLTPEQVFDLVNHHRGGDTLKQLVAANAAKVATRCDGATAESSAVAPEGSLMSRPVHSALRAGEGEGMCRRVKALALVGLMVVGLSGCRVPVGGYWSITVDEPGWSDGIHGLGIDIFVTPVPVIANGANP